MFISPAYAQDAGGSPESALISLLPIVLIFVVFYFLLIRPQQKKAKEHRNMIENLRRGDRIVTNGGIIGSITKVLNDREVQVEIADGVRVRIMRGMVADLMSKSEPAESAPQDDEDPDLEDEAAEIADADTEAEGAAKKKSSLLRR